MATFLIGYDTEHRDPSVTRHFLKAARRVHEDLDVPGCLFIVGRTLRQSLDQFASLVGSPLFDFSSTPRRTCS